MIPNFNYFLHFAPKTQFLEKENIKKQNVRLAEVERLTAAIFTCLVLKPTIWFSADQFVK